MGEKTKETGFSIPTYTTGIIIMKNTFIHNKSIALFITFFISVITFNYWLSAKAQNTSSTAKAPTYTGLQDAKNFQIKGKGKAFLPKKITTNQ